MKTFAGSLLLGAALLLGTLGAAEPKSDVWKFPLAKGTRGVTLTVPDWGKEGFSAEVWCKPESADCGYAILIRKSFGFPNFFNSKAAKDYDNYLYTADDKSTAGRVYTKLEPGKYHYYALTGTPTENISYRDGKLMRRIAANGIPAYNGSPMYVGNSIGWRKKNFEGEIALIRVYNRALTPEEIAEHDRLLRENKKLPKSAGLIFEADRRGLPPENAGQTVTETLDNRSVDKVFYPPSRHIAGKPEKEPAQIGFEDLSGWTVTYVAGEIEPVITRSKEEPLWGDYVLRAEFRRGPLAKPGAKVVLAPPKPIRIADDFDAVNIWRFATPYDRNHRPHLSYSIQYRTADGQVYSTDRMGGLLEVGWGIHHHVTPKLVKAPAEFVSITFGDFNEPVKVIYLDALRFYKRDLGPLPDARVPSWQELGVPTRPETILPTPAEPGIVTLKAAGPDTWRFESVTASGKKLVYTVTPATGTLSDITATYNGKTFRPADGGGFCWALDNLFPVKDESLLAPQSPRVRARLDRAAVKDGKLVLDWVYTVDGKQTRRGSWLLEVRDNTLIADLKADPAVGEFRFGAVTGIAGKVVEIPYLNLGRWGHRSDPPGIFASDGVYVSALVDWYNSDASGLFGQSSSTPGGHWYLDPSTADHRWKPDPNAKDMTDTVRKVSIINGGSYYWPKTDGSRNPARDRIMITVSDRLAAILPNIPNPTHKYLKTTAEDVWSTRQWYVRKLPVPDYFDRELAMWRACRDYGMTRINMRLHVNVNRMYTPQSNGDPTTFIESFCEPAIGGDRKMAEFFAGMKKLGMKIGLYTDHMLLSQLSYNAWDENMLNLDSNSDWIYSSGMKKQTKISRMRNLQKKYNALYREMFAPNCAYLDQVTCPPCWRYTDYDARAPEAGKFSAVFRVFVETLRQEEADFGPVLSEGKTHMALAGLCDSYAQPQRADIHLLPDFNLRKIHTLTNDCGYELSYGSTRADRKNASEVFYRFLACEYGYGSTGHIFGIYHGEPFAEIPDLMIRSYFLIQPAQKHYALVPVKAVLYPVNGKLAPVEAAIQAGTLRQNQVKIVYENGLEVGVNLNAEKDFTVILNGKTYTLPPSGFAAYLPGKLEAFSARNRAGKRADFMKEGDLLFVANAPDQNEIEAGFDYTVRRPADGSVELTPAPFKKAETVSLAVPFRTQAKVAALDRAGKVVSECQLPVENGRVRIAVDGKAFRYRITK